MIARTRDLPEGPGRVLRAAFTLAWFALLRPTEYMLTPGHPTFDPSRHMRASDIQFYNGATPVTARQAREATHMTVNIKQSKTDWQRLGAMMTIGSTGGPNCPVRLMHEHMMHRTAGPDDAAFPGLKYATMLRVTRNMIPKDPELYGLHSFRVGGAQALALAGRTFEYIMAKGRWKHAESVIRYVETPTEVKVADAVAMTTATAILAAQPGSVWGRNTQQQRHGRGRK